MYTLFLKFYFLESIVFCDICCTLIDLVVIQYLQSKDDSDDSSDESDEEPPQKKPKGLNFWCLLFDLKILVYIAFLILSQDPSSGSAKPV